MLLSEAIIKGSEGRGQCKEAYILPDGRVCALGAVAKALNICNITADNFIDKQKYGLSTYLVRMNDKEGLTFQEIINKLKKENLDVELDAAK